jgi:hypothetical protein
MPSRKRDQSQRRKQKKENRRIDILLGIILAVVVIAVLTLSLNPNNLLNLFPIVHQKYNYNCGELQIDINSMKEAAAYYRYGIQKPAGANYKFEILGMKVTNNAPAYEDLSGFRLKLIANDGSVFTSTQFSSIEKITLADNTEENYSCSELPIASISQFGLNSTQSAEGCKIFLMLNNLTPSSLQVYNSTGLKCTLSLG